MEKHPFADIVMEGTSKIVFLIMDGLGGVQDKEKGGTELQVARTPHLDQLARESVCGLLDPVSPGISPGSGPAHFALFGYDPIQFSIGRGVLEAAGIDFPLTADDVVARINFCTVDSDGVITDRRAGRIETRDTIRICKKLEHNIKKHERLQELLIKPVKEHRAVVVFRGKELYGDIDDTDPQKTGLKPLPPKALNSESSETAHIVANFIQQVAHILADEPKANMLLLRGFAKHRTFPSMLERYKLKSVALASYPMYKGIARLLGMNVIDNLATIADEIAALKTHFSSHDFFFIHIKPTDSRGEDGDFDAKVKAIEEVDGFIPQIRELNPDVLVVTGDHSTPALLKSHSWHPVPVVLNAPFCRTDHVDTFDEISCIQGGLGRMRSVHLIWIALANANRLAKFGA